MEVQTYQGYFQACRFVPKKEAAIPDNVEVYVVVTEKAVPEPATLSKKQRLDFEEFTQAISQAEPLGKEFDEIIGQGICVGLKFVNWKN